MFRRKVSVGWNSSADKPFFNCASARFFPPESGKCRQNGIPPLTSLFFQVWLRRFRKGGTLDFFRRLTFFQLWLRQAAEGQRAGPPNVFRPKGRKFCSKHNLDGLENGRSCISALPHFSERKTVKCQKKKEHRCISLFYKREGGEF